MGRAPSTPAGKAMSKPRAPSLPGSGTVPLVPSALGKEGQFDESKVCVLEPSSFLF